jgi:hypothetical protein
MPRQTQEAFLKRCYRNTRKRQIRKTNIVAQDLTRQERRRARSAFFDAIVQSRERTMQMLDANAADPVHHPLDFDEVDPKSGHTPLSVALACVDDDLAPRIAKLCSEKTLVRRHRRDGHTPLSKAILLHEVKSVRALLSRLDRDYLNGHSGRVYYDGGFVVPRKPGLERITPLEFASRRVGDQRCFNAKWVPKTTAVGATQAEESRTASEEIYCLIRDAACAT